MPIVGGDIAPRVEFGAGITNNHQIARNVGCAGNGITPLAIHKCISTPHHRAVNFIKGKKVAIEGGDEYRFPR